MSDSDKVDKFDLSAGVPPIAGTLRPKPKFADRISKRILGVGFGAVAILVAIFLVSLDNVDKKKEVVQAPVAEVKKSEADIEAQNAVPKELLGAVDGESAASAGAATTGTAGVRVAVPSLIPAVAGAQSGRIPPQGTVPALGTAGAGGIPPDQSSAPPTMTPEQQAREVARQAREMEKQARAQRQAQARMGGLAGKTFDGDVTPSASEASGSGAAEMAELLAAGKAAIAPAAGGAAPAGGGPKTTQDEKLDFLKAASKEERSYHPHLPLAAASRHEVKAGATINMTLAQGINSDIPGQVTARVSEPVWDTVTGCLMLVPPMSTMIGKYDSKVALGQGRNLVVWSNLIDPDGAELNMGGMQGYDTTGEAGLKSDVNNHYFKLFGLTFGMSMITAATQLSVPQPNPSPSGASAGQTPGQVVAASLAQQYGTLGAEVISKNMAVQPTLTNKLGERFMIVVPRTMIFGKVWRNRCQGK